MKTHIMTTAALGKVVMNARKAQQLTQSELAGLANTGRRFISDLENGKETVQLGKVILILSQLGVAMELVRYWKGIGDE